MNRRMDTFLEKKDFPTASQIVARVEKLVSLPKAIQRILQEIDSQKATVTSIAETIATDPPLAARILRLSNSGFYARGEKANNIGTAISRLGLKEIRNIATTTIMATMTTKSQNQAILQELYKYSVMSAATTNVVLRYAKAANQQDKEIPFYTSALLHDLGLFLLHRFEPKMIEHCMAIARQEKQQLIDVELNEFGFHHGKLGAMAIQRWRLTECESNVCEWHHTPNSGPQRYSIPIYVVHFADYLMRYVVPSDDIKLMVSTLAPETFDVLAIDPDQITEILHDARHEIKKAQELMAAIQS